MKWTGLTGGIATGKSTVKKLLESLGYPVIDADQISHELTEVGRVGYEKILSHFGTAILHQDLTIDRKKLGQIIFTNPNQKTFLENILHPLIRTEVLNLKKIYEEKGTSLCFYDVPLLFEKDMQGQFDKTVLIWCSPEIQIQRFMNRNQISREEALLRIENQLPMSEKIKRADHCVDNSGQPDDLLMQIQKLLPRLL